MVRYGYCCGLRRYVDCVSCPVRYGTVWLLVAAAAASADAEIGAVVGYSVVRGSVLQDRCGACAVVRYGTVACCCYCGCGNR